MHWQDEGYLLSKNNFDENSIIIEAFTANHGKYSGIVYGGSSRKQKRFFQIGNKLLIDWQKTSKVLFQMHIMWYESKMLNETLNSLQKALENTTNNVYIKICLNLIKFYLILS